jgi:hypothetical protein
MGRLQLPHDAVDAEFAHATCITAAGHCISEILV